MSSGIKITKQGRSISSPDQSDFYVNSDTPLLKIATIIRDSFTFNHLIDNFVPKYIYHNLGYVPAFLLFMDRRTDGSRQLVTSEDEDFGDTLPTGDKQLLATAEADIAAVVFTCNASLNGSMDGVYTYTLILFYDELAATI